MLGEFPADEAALLRELIARDAGLARLQDRLKPTLDLLRETIATAEVAPANPPKLSPERREKLLAQFKTVAPKEFAAPHDRRVSLLLLFAGVASVAILASLMLPALSRAKTKGINTLGAGGVEKRSFLGLRWFHREDESRESKENVSASASAVPDHAEDLSKTWSGESRRNLASPGPRQAVVASSPNQIVLPTPPTADTLAAAAAPTAQPVTQAISAPASGDFRFYGDINSNGELSPTPSSSPALITSTPLASREAGIAVQPSSNGELEWSGHLMKPAQSLLGGDRNVGQVTNAALSEQNFGFGGPVEAQKATLAEREQINAPKAQPADSNEYSLNAAGIIAGGAFYLDSNSANLPTNNGAIGLQGGTAPPSQSAPLQSITIDRPGNGQVASTNFFVDKDHGQLSIIADEQASQDASQVISNPGVTMRGVGGLMDLGDAKEEPKTPVAIKPEVIPMKYASASDVASALDALGASGGAAIGRSTAGTNLAAANGRSIFQNNLNKIVENASGSEKSQMLADAKVIADERNNSLLIFANDDDKKKIEDILKKLDVAPPQAAPPSMMPQPEVLTQHQRFFHLLAQCQRCLLQAGGGELAKGRHARGRQHAQRGVHQRLRLSRSRTGAGRAHRLCLGTRRLSLRPQPRLAALLRSRPPRRDARRAGR